MSKVNPPQITHDYEDYYDFRDGDPVTDQRAKRYADLLKKVTAFLKRRHRTCREVNEAFGLSDDRRKQQRMRQDIALILHTIADGYGSTLRPKYRLKKDPSSTQVKGWNKGSSEPSDKTKADLGLI